MWLPLAKAILLCEDKLDGPANTGNIHLMNVFSAIRPESFPHVKPQICVFLQLTDYRGEGGGNIIIRQADSETIVYFGSEHQIEFLDRRQLKWVLFKCPDCRFPAPGVYWVEFHFKGELVVDQVLNVIG